MLLPEEHKALKEEIKQAVVQDFNEKFDSIDSRLSNVEKEVHEIGDKLGNGVFAEVIATKLANSLGHYSAGAFEKEAAAALLARTKAEMKKQIFLWVFGLFGAGGIGWVIIMKLLESAG